MSVKVCDVVAEILKREEVQFLIAYPVNDIIEAAARADIRTIIVRSERTGLHMADGFSRLSCGRRFGVFAMQQGPGAENAFGGVAQAYADSVPILALPAGFPRAVNTLPPNFSAYDNYRRITKWAELATLPAVVPDALRRAFSHLRNGRPRPVLLEIPADVLSADFPGRPEYQPATAARAAPDPQAVAEAARVLAEARRPLLYAGQGVHYARAWPRLRELAELLAAPVMTSLQGKSAFPENHPLSLGSGGRAIPKPVHHFLQRADVICGLGCSFTQTGFGVSVPQGKTVIHATLDPADLNQYVRADYPLLGDADLTLEALIAAVRDRLGNARREAGPVAAEIAAVKAEWMTEWLPRLTSGEVPLSPYRVLWELMHNVPRADTIITHDAGSPRDELSPFWEAVTPLSYIGWGKSTQLGYGLGLAMGAKLAQPDKLCINVMGDAAIGMTGMDFETAVREGIPILTVVLNNSCMAIELPIMQTATEKYRSTDISGNYAELARALGGYGERVTTPADIAPAIQRGIRKTQEGTPALLEFITSKENRYSLFG
jgi:thiamine pyrophosphate-dependent acetolactate synthase large subunit-like protein